MERGNAIREAYDATSPAARFWRPDPNEGVSYDGRATHIPYFCFDCAASGCRTRLPGCGIGNKACPLFCPQFCGRPDPFRARNRPLM